MKTEFRRNKETNQLEAWRDGKFVGVISTLGDDIGPGDKAKPKEKKDNK